MEPLAPIQHVASDFHHGKDLNAPAWWQLVVISNTSGGEGEAEPWQSACWAFPIFLSSSPGMHQPRPLLEVGSWTLSYRRDFSHLSHGHQHPVCSPRRWEDRKPMAQEIEVGIKAVTNTTIYKVKNGPPVLSGFLPESLNMSLKVNSKKPDAFFTCIATKPRN